MKILLTGSEGFVGCYLRKELERLNHIVICIDRMKLSRLKYHCYDLANDISILSKNLKDHKFDVLIHLAAAKGDYNLSFEDFYRDNVIASRNLIKLVDDLDIRSVIMYSTVSVYGHNNALKTEEATLEPNNSYGKTKLESENLFQSWYESNPLEHSLTILRPSVIYGENNFANMYNLISQLNRKIPISVGNGNYIKSMIAVENMIEITLFSLDNIRGLQVYNCTDSPYPKLNEVINYIVELDGFNKPRIVIPKWLAYWIGGVFELIALIVKKDLGITRDRIHKYTMPTDYRSEKLLNKGYKQKYSVKDRVQNMAKWYLNRKQKHEV